jgi:hypothetical protein
MKIRIPVWFTPQGRWVAFGRNRQDDESNAEAALAQRERISEHDKQAWQLVMVEADVPDVAPTIRGHNLT